MMVEEKEEKREEKHKKDHRTSEKESKITLEVVKKAKKSELIEYCEHLGLNTEGKVDDLRDRLSKYLEKKVEPKKVAAKKLKVEEEEEEAEEEEVEIEEEGEYVPKKKPTLSTELRQQLALRRQIATRRPNFLRQEWFRYKKLGFKWRKPKGMHSKLRRHFKYRINVASIGYRGPIKTRGFHPSGFKEVLVHNPGELEGLDPEKQAVRIASAVGMRKRKLIEEAATEKGLRVLNRSGRSES